MAYYDLAWYVNSVGYAAVAARPQNTAVVAGTIRRQATTPTVGNERCFVCIIAGTTANVTDATWVLTRGAKTVDGTVTWMECTGQVALNGDLTNTPSWATFKALGFSPSLGVVIKRNSGASYQICTTAGTLGASEPAFSNTAGVTTNESSTVWTCLGPVGNFTGGQAPFARLASACTSTWFVTGNTVYVGNNHNESQSTAISIAPAGSLSSLINKILCHNSSGSYPPGAGDLTTGATVATAGSQINLLFNPGGATYVYGLTFKSSVGGTTGTGAQLSFTVNTLANQSWIYLDNCSLQLATTTSTASMQIGNLSTATAIFLNNTTVSFGHSNHFMWPTLARLCWQNTGPILAAGSAVPATGLLGQSNANGSLSDIVLEALDLSQITGNIYDAAQPTLGNLLIKNCKLHASSAIERPLSTCFAVQLASSAS